MIFTGLEFPVRVQLTDKNKTGSNSIQNLTFVNRPTHEYNTRCLLRSVQTQELCPDMPNIRKNSLDSVTISLKKRAPQAPSDKHSLSGKG